jgi:2-polyprenyl-3-methyl-5-hydroxy-6-metoxy-1,4-benzoquinol methylase
MRKHYDDKVEKVGKVEYRYSSSWIYSLESENHWRLYWQQQHLMRDEVKAGQHILEIGVGSGFTANYLRSKGVNVTTMDIDVEKQPDIVGNIVTFDWNGLSFDHILAFEVFEHIPLAEFSNLLLKLSSICSGYLFLSLPKGERRWLHCEITLPKLGTRTLRIASKRSKIIEPHHFWEVGIGITKDGLNRLFIANGFTICQEELKNSRIFLKLKATKSTDASSTD